MKGVIAIICAMSMCLLLIVTAFAAETSGNSFAIHAEKAEREAVLAEMRQTASNATLQEFGVIVDEGTMMPVYYGSLLDYAKTGNLFMNHLLLVENNCTFLMLLMRRGALKV